jgi:hypothetical protein
MEGQTDRHMMKLIVSFRNFTEGPNKRKICIIALNLVINTAVTSEFERFRHIHVQSSCSCSKPKALLVKRNPVKQSVLCRRINF